MFVYFGCYQNALPGFTEDVFKVPIFFGAGGKVPPLPGVLGGFWSGLGMRGK